ncbi:MAG TPA: low temperature requirement protein A [Bacteroidia bacterium]|nr:low temperature requirement protein A [Bacteroidia bacterium]
MINRLLFREKNLQSPAAQNADFVELFFDLVFVYAITNITAATAHHFDVKHVMQSVLTFWLIWWGWTQFTWALNAANTKIPGIRLVMLAATAVAFVMASSAGQSFSEGVLWFALPYIIIRAIGLLLYIRVSSSLAEHHAAVISFAIPSVLGLTAVLVGALVNPESRAMWWLAIILLDMVAAYIGGRAEGWNLHPSHFAERHGLIVIIALGESLIVSASAVSALELSAPVLLSGGLAVLITCLLWWSYFGWIFGHMEEHLAEKSGSKQASVARDVYSLMHFPLICGIIGISVGFEHILQFPNDLLAKPTAYAFCGGYVLFIGFSALSVWRSSKEVLLSRLIILVLTIAAVPLTVGKPSYGILGIIAISLLVLTLIEWKKIKGTHA